MNHFISNIPFLIVLVGICPGVFGTGVIVQRVYVRGGFVLIPYVCVFLIVLDAPASNFFLKFRPPHYKILDPPMVEYTYYESM